jgi:hypothetical protein
MGDLLIIVALVPFTLGVLVGAIAMALAITAPEAADRRSIRRHDRARAALAGRRTT